MKRILVGLVLLAVIAGGAVAFGQSSDAPDPLAARIAELRAEYERVNDDIARVADYLEGLRAQSLRLEGGIIELQRLQTIAAQAADLPKTASAPDPGVPIEDVLPPGTEIGPLEPQ